MAAQPHSLLPTPCLGSRGKRSGGGGEGGRATSSWGPQIPSASWPPLDRRRQPPGLRGRVPPPCIPLNTATAKIKKKIWPGPPGRNFPLPPNRPQIQCGHILDKILSKLPKIASKKIIFWGGLGSPVVQWGGGAKSQRPEVEVGRAFHKQPNEFRNLL